MKENTNSNYFCWHKISVLCVYIDLSTLFRNNLINELGQTASEGPNCKYNNLDTNDLENLIKAKQQEMNQLKEEESTLLQRKRRYVSSKEKCPIKVNS